MGHKQILTTGHAMGCSVRHPPPFLSLAFLSLEFVWDFGSPGRLRSRAAFNSVVQIPLFCLGNLLQSPDQLVFLRVVRQLRQLLPNQLFSHLARRR